MDRATVVLVTLVVYKVALLTLGLVAERRTRSEADFVLGGRRLGPIVAAMSASASSSSVWTLLGVSGYAYSQGLAALWLLPACVGGFALNWWLIAPRLRAHAGERGALTLTELLAGRARGSSFAATRAVASMVLIVSLTAYVAAQLHGAGKSFHANFPDLSIGSSILIGSAIVVAYTLLGGFWAVSLTDTLQGALMAVTAVLLPVGAVAAIGGPAVLWSSLDGVSPGFASVWPGTGGIGTLLAVAVLLSIALGYPGQPHVVNRFMALADPRTLVVARRCAMAWAIVVYTGMIVLGLSARVLLADPLADGETAFFTTMNRVFPPVVAGVMFAAVLSAIMSTADSQLLVAASAVSYDLGLRPRREAHALLWSRAVVVLVSAAAVAIALSASQTIFDTVLIAWTAIGAAFGPLLVVTLWKGPVGPTRSLLAILIGFGATAAGYASAATRAGPVERTLPYVLAFAVLMVGWRREGVERR